MRRWAQVNGMRQGGIALLVFVIVLALAAIAYALSDVSIVQVRYAEKLKTQTALKQAKQALLDYALTYEDDHPGEYGFLPCPDTGEDMIVEGGSHSTCGLKQVNTIGLFPWASLETGVLKSGTDNCFWYAVSGEYKAAPKTDMLNEDTNGSMRVYDAEGVLKQGLLAQDRVVAIVIDPSNALPGQNRTIDEETLCGKDYDPASGNEYKYVEYLEGNGVIDNSDLSGVALDVDDFITKSHVSDTLTLPFNDRVITITRDELWDAIRSRKDFVENSDSAMRRLTEALALCIASYGNNSGNRKLPRPAAVDFSGNDYRDDVNYKDTAAASYLGLSLIHI